MRLRQRIALKKSHDGVDLLCLQCPIELSMSILAGRWKTTIICQLLKGKKRYGELKKGIIGVNHKMLAEQLRELEEAG